MPYTKSPRPYKKEYQKQKERGEHEGRMERQRARRAMDAKGVDRTGKDVSHSKMISEGGTNADGYKLESPSKNRARNGQAPAKRPLRSLHGSPLKPRKFGEVSSLHKQT